jgi:hypothetical protein
MGDEEHERRESSEGAAEAGEDLKEDFESDAVTNREEAEDNPTMPEDLRGG